MKLFAAVFIFASLVSSALYYLNLPVAGINQGGRCVYLIEDGVKSPCEKVPAKYVAEVVAGWE